MRLSQIIKSLKSIFEIKRKNPIQLNNDSNLESNLKPLKVSDKSTPIQISEDTVDVKGSLKVNGTDVVTGEAGATKLNELSDVTYSSGDLTISSLDKIVASGLELETDSLDITMDSFRDFVVDAGRSIILDSDTGYYIAKKAGTEFSAANSAYAGMILGYTRIQDNSTTPGTDYITINSSSMTVLQTVAGTNLSINFIVPPSGNVEIDCRFFVSAVSDGAKFSLSTGTSYAELDEKHTYDADYTFFIDETDHFVANVTFAVTGLTAGTDTTYYLAGVASGASTFIRHGRFRTAGTHSPPIILKATALPATITTGE